MSDMSLNAAVDCLSQVLVVWDEACYRHCQRTSEYAATIAGELGIASEELEQIRIGALLHDIGQVGLDLEVLRKPGELDPADREHVRLHPGMGASILARVLPAAIVECAAAHHEQPDGLGYPHGLTEAQIPLGAQICRVADVLDSLTTAQTYRAAMTLDEAVAELRDGAGRRYSSLVVDALLRLIERRDANIAA